MRIQFELTKEKYGQFESLMKRAGVRTKKDLLHNALALLEWFIKEKEAGMIIASIDKEGKVCHEVIMPMLFLKGDL